jgi:predicted nucleic acid-binding protein
VKTALDSSVILDVLTGDKKWADASESALRHALLRGPLVIGECVLAEITPALEESEMDQFLADWKILYLPSTPESARKAGEMYRKYLLRSPKKDRVLPDFLIGAHAQFYTGCLLARDRGYYRDYFDGLTLIEPGQ